jgi:hypothetical protein
MRTVELYKNQTQMLEGIRLRKSLGNLVEDAETADLKALGYLMLQKEWTEEEIDADLGSSAIETLLDEIENADHTKIVTVVKTLRDQGAII